ncbi:DinB family protein [Rhodopila sp.]|uniref:DinB family protein n=1 Tax=Rhodopila sp. TaxID=2480087 RepID=UPI002CDBBA45|nr:DinB family protein [Rhodopila sp.]HVZ08838.1 DinB family protein [Rhodopila sp.]
MLSRGDDWVFAQNLGHVVKFIGLTEDVGPVLPPDQLVRRLTTFLATAVRIVAQMPDAALDTEVPNRPRSYRVLGHHIFRIPEAMLEVAAGGYLDSQTSNLPPPDDMRSFTAIAAYGQDVLGRLQAWWGGRADKTACDTVQTYYGPQSLHELMERTTWHSGQHVRQWFMLLDRAGITPVVRLDEADFADLPMPSSVWDG